MDDASAPPRSRPWGALAASLLPAILVAASVAVHISPDIPFDSDEANHANLGLKQFHDLADGDLADFARHSYRTGQFPFFHGWMLLPGLTLFGTTLFAARVTQCVLFVIGAAATGWAAYRASGGNRRAAVISSWLFALSPPLAAMAGLCMLEVPGAALTAVTLAAFAEACHASGRKAAWWHALTAVAAIATYFTKLNYGLWVAPAVLAGHAVRVLDPERRREALRHAGLYLGLIVAVAAIWYSGAEARASFMGFLNNPAEKTPVVQDAPSFAVPGLRLASLFEYFPLVAGEFHLHGALGTVVLCLGAVGFLAGWRRPAVVAVAACLVWTWLVLSMGFREYTLGRFIATALPALWVLAGCGAAAVLERMPDRRKSLELGGAALFAAGLAFQLHGVPRVLAAEYEVGTEFVATFDFVAEHVEAPASVLSVNYTDHTSARTLVWALATAAPGRRYSQHDVKGLIAERVFESATSFDRWMERERPWGDATWQSYVVEYVPGPDYADPVIAETVKLWADAVQRHAERLELVEERRFEALDVTIRVWRDRNPPAHRGP